MDHEDWKDQEDLFGDDGGGNCEADGGGQRWLPEADGADQVVEQYWESRGEVPSEATDMTEARELEEDGAGEEDETMWADLGAGEDEGGIVRSWSEELQSKKRRADLEL